MQVIGLGMSSARRYHTECSSLYLSNQCTLYFYKMSVVGMKSKSRLVSCTKTPEQKYNERNVSRAQQINLCKKM